MVHRVLRSLTLVAAALGISGCCSIAQLACGFDAPEAAVRETRDTPEQTINYVIGAVSVRDVTSIFETLHPQFVERYGGWTASDFAVGFDRYEDEFVDLAALLKEAQRTAVVWEDGDAYIRVQNGESHAVLVFRNAPRYRIHLKDEELPFIEGPLTDVAGSIHMEGGKLTVTRALELRGYEGIPPQLVKRVEMFDDWLLLDVPQYEGIAFMELMEEQSR
jgi:hypothetical protein